MVEAFGEKPHGIGINMTMDILGEIMMWFAQSVDKFTYPPLKFDGFYLVNDSTVQRKFLLDAIIFPVVEICRIFRYCGRLLCFCWDMYARSNLDAQCFSLCLPSFNDNFFFFPDFEVEGNWQTYNCSCKDIVVIILFGVHSLKLTACPRK